MNVFSQLGKQVSQNAPTNREEKQCFTLQNIKKEHITNDVNEDYLDPLALRSPVPITFKIIKKEEDDIKEEDLHPEDVLQDESEFSVLQHNLHEHEYKDAVNNVHISNNQESVDNGNSILRCILQNTISSNNQNVENISQKGKQQPTVNPAPFQHSKIRNINKNTVYGCSICNKGYHRTGDLTRHIRSNHSSIGKYKCIICSKIYTKGIHLKNHVYSFHNLKELDIFKSKEVLASHDQEEKYVKNNQLKNRINGVRLKDCDYKCKQCNKAFSELRQLKVHYNSNSHKNFMKFKCYHCKKKFSYLSELKLHIDDVHRRSENIVCAHCGKRFLNSSYLKSHIDEIHSKIKNFQCKHCGKKFAEKLTLQIHAITVHKKLSNIRCEVVSDQAVKPMSQNTNVNREQCCTPQNIKKEHMTNDVNGKCLDPLAIKNPVPITFEKLLKEEDDFKEKYLHSQDLLQNESKHSDLQDDFNDHGYQDSENTACISDNAETADNTNSILKCLLQSSIPSNIEKVEEISRQGKQQPAVNPAPVHQSQFKKLKEIKMYACSTCNEKYSQISDLIMHISMIHFSIGRCKCGICSRSFLNPNYLRRHARKIHNYKEFEKICLLQSSIPSNIEKVEDISRQDKQQPTVNPAPVHQSQFKKLKEIKMYACSTCNEKYSQISDLIMHISMIHFSIGRCKCGICSRSFLNPNYLRRHARKIHNYKELDIFESKRTLTCHDCDKKYSSLYLLKYHINKVHLQNSDYRYKQCNNAYFGFLDLQRHYKTEKHKNFRKFKSDQCKKKFPHLSLLKQHSVTHTRSKNPVCAHCGKRFFNSFYLKTHIYTVHLNIKDFECEHCGKKFDEIRFLLQHVDAVHKKVGNFEYQNVISQNDEINREEEQSSTFHNINEEQVTNKLNGENEDPLSLTNVVPITFEIFNKNEDHVKGEDLHAEDLLQEVSESVKNVMSQNDEINREEEQSSTFHNINEEQVTNNLNGENEDPLSLTNAVPITFEIFNKNEDHVKGEEDLHAEDLLQEVSESADVQNNFSEHEFEDEDNTVYRSDNPESSDNRNGILNSLLANTVYNDNQNVEEISRQEQRRSSLEVQSNHDKRHENIVDVSKKVNVSESDNDNEVYTCGNCDMKYSSFSNLKEHIYKLHLGTEQQKSSLEVQSNHDKWHKNIVDVSKKVNVSESDNDNEVYTCGNCDMKYSSFSNLKEHIYKLHLGTEQQKSSLGVQSNHDKQHENVLDVYKKSEGDNEVHTCDTCDKKYSSSSSLQKHIYELDLGTGKQQPTVNPAPVHHSQFKKLNEIKMYACSTCNEGYSQISDLIKHIRITHSNIGSYKCIICSKSFLKPYRLKKHACLIHNYKEFNIFDNQRTFACHDCDLKYSTNYLLKHHINSVHLQNSDYKCKQCNKIYFRLSELRRHYKTEKHKNFMKLECDHCKKKFSHLSLLKVHIGVHNRSKKFECAHCGIKFFIPSLLKAHINKIHLKIKNFQCEYCGKHFAEKVQLQQHTNLVHKKIRSYNYECQFCCKKFQHMHHLQNHIICVHEKVKNFICELCGDRFLLAHHLRNHLKYVHKGIDRCVNSVVFA